MIDFLAGVAIASLAGMGIGGGGLLVLYLVFVKDVGQMAAQGLNLVFFMCASSASLFFHSKKRKINWRLVIMLGVLGAAGALPGAWIASVLDPGVVRKVFGWLLMISGGAVLFDGRKK